MMYNIVKNHLFKISANEFKGQFLNLATTASPQQHLKEIYHSGNNQMIAQLWYQANVEQLN